MALLINTEGRGVCYDERTTLANGNWDMLFMLENISFEDYMFYRFNLPVEMIERMEAQSNEGLNADSLIAKAEEMKANSRVKSTPLVASGLSIISNNTPKKTLKAPTEQNTVKKVNTSFDVSKWFESAS